VHQSGRRGIRQALIRRRELLAAARVLRDEESVERGFEVVGLVDLAGRPDRVVVALDEDGHRIDLGRVQLVEHHLPDSTIGRTEGLAGM
jgi:hypothetical protein